jgi:glycosyltransferase involved in cell wall biosynthesis
VIGSDSGAIPEVLDDSGLVFPEGNARTLADAIDRLRRDSSLRETLAQKGRKQTLERYAWDAIAHQMREVYLQTMDAVASPPGPLRNSPASAAHSEEAR